MKHYSYGIKKWYKPETLRTKIIVTIVLLLFIRILSNVPLPFVDKEYLATIFSGKEGALAMLNSFSGGAFLNMTVMAMGVTPYITASIILQLLTIAIPGLEEIQKDGDYGRKKWEKIQICVGLGLGVLQSVALSISLGKQGVFTTYNIGVAMLVSLIWAIGSAICIAIGTYITKFGIGNGISLILTFNIIAELPSDVTSFYEAYLHNKNFVEIIVNSCVFILIVGMLIAATIVLCNAQKNITVMYAGRNNKLGQAKNTSSIPIKLNASGVMPVIFASTIFGLPAMFLQGSTSKIAQGILHFCSSTYWFDLDHWWRILGLFVYGLMVIGFAYFYSQIAFNPLEISTNLKKQGAFIPGVRPGKPTADYLTAQMKYMTFWGAVFLFLLTQIPTVICHFSHIGSLSFGGTSIIIIVGVCQETAMVIKAETIGSSYKVRSKSFLGMTTNTVRRGVLQ